MDSYGETLFPFAGQCFFLKVIQSGILVHKCLELDFFLPRSTNVYDVELFFVISKVSSLREGVRTLGTRMTYPPRRWLRHIVCHVMS